MTKKLATTEETTPTDSMMDAETLTAIKPVTELVVDERGTFIGKHSERLKLTRKSGPVQEVPLATLRQVLITSSGVSLSSDAVEECAQRGIAIHFLDYAGRAYASLFSGQLTGTVKTRRAQLLAYTDERGLWLAKAFASGKIRNQLNVLRYMSKNRAATNPTLHAEVRQATSQLEVLFDQLLKLPGANVDAIRAQLLNMEGRAAQLYWAQFKNLLLVETDWPGREGQGATDLVNSLLNYGYGVLCTRVEQALMLAGLDPFAGFIHTDRPGKPSLVYDLVEEFRQAVVDRVVVSLLNLKVDLALDSEGRLDGETRKLLVRKIVERLNDSSEKYEKKQHTLQYILYSQARHIATYVRGDLGREYEAYVCSW